jgi:hypothetical protein
MEECFIICPIGNESSEQRKRSDKLLKHVFKPVLDRNGYKALRADQIPKVGFITTQIINLIIESPLVIADLTDSNPNVFYELAIRHAIRKPYIQVIEKGQKIPFDLSGIRTIEIDITDLDNVESAIKEIDKHILEFKKGYIPDSPISVASSAKIIQNDSDLAEEIADKLGYFTHFPDYSNFSYDDNAKVDEISRKLWGFREYSNISLEDINSKLDEILSKLNK